MSIARLPTKPVVTVLLSGGEAGTYDDPVLLPMRSGAHAVGFEVTDGVTAVEDMGGRGYNPQTIQAPMNTIGAAVAGGTGFTPSAAPMGYESWPIGVPRMLALWTELDWRGTPGTAGTLTFVWFAYQPIAEVEDYHVEEDIGEPVPEPVPEPEPNPVPPTDNEVLIKEAVGLLDRVIGLLERVNGTSATHT